VFANAYNFWSFEVSMYLIQGFIPNADTTSETLQLVPYEPNEQLPATRIARGYTAGFPMACVQHNSERIAVTEQDFT
jgi:hypothetical protein